MKTMNPITEVNGYSVLSAEGQPQWYDAMAINSHEQDVAALHESWGTANKYRGEECGRCRGRGYTRKDGNIGCIVCGGTGVVDE